VAVAVLAAMARRLAMKDVVAVAVAVELSLGLCLMLIVSQLLLL